MVKSFIVFYLLVLGVMNVYGQVNRIFMIGPTLHFNFGDEKFNVSVGAECSYWNWKNFPYSVNGGVEYGSKKVRFYSEGQTGIGVLGLSFGPVVQYNFQNAKFSIGTQGSGWINYFGGVDLRFRFIDDTKILSPGLYAKVPFGFGFYDNTNGENHNHWDWD